MNFENLVIGIQWFYPNLPQGNIWQKHGLNRIYFNLQDSSQPSFFIDIDESLDPIGFRFRNFTDQIITDFSINLEIFRIFVQKILIIDPSINLINYVIKLRKILLVDLESSGYNSYEDFINSNEMYFPGATEYYEFRSQMMNSGFKRYPEFQEAKNKGCDTYSEWKIMKSNRYKHYTHYTEAITLKIPSAKRYYKHISEMKFRGIENYLDFKLRLKWHFIDKPTILKLKSIGYRSYDDYTEANTLKFPNASSYYQLISIIIENQYPNYPTYKSSHQTIEIYGYPSYLEYDEIHEKLLSGGFGNYETFIKASKIGITTDKEYQLNQQELAKKYIKGGFPDIDTFESAQIYGIDTYEEYKRSRGKRCRNCRAFSSITATECRMCNSKMLEFST